MSARFRIGDLTLDTGRRLLLCDSKPIALGPLTYRLLLTLVEAAPDVVTHDELVRSIWRGRSVSPETINQRIKLLRDALADDAGNPRYVEGVRGQGYRLLPRVEVLPDESPARHRPRWMVPTGAAIFLAAVAAIAFWVMTAQQPDAVHESASVAILPFTDLSPGRDQQYLADGLAEEIINLLSRSTTLRVIARTSSFSFRGKDADVARISKALGVTHVLEGSVRREGDSIRVTVRLVDASNGSRLWSDSYDRRMGDVLVLETNVARSVAAELRANLQNLADVPAKGVNEQAYELYLRGQHELRVQRFGEGARYLEQAIAIDPGFIPAYHSLGLAYRYEVADVRVPMAEDRAKLREMLSRGQRLAPDDAGLLAFSGHLARWDGDIKLAEQRFATALRKDPSNRIVQRMRATFKLDQGYPNEALALTRRFREIDPLNSNLYVGAWSCYMDLGNSREALAAAERYREIVPTTNPTTDHMINARGELQPVERHDVFAPRDGVVTAIHVDHGQTVAAGDALLEMRSPELDLEVQRVDGELETARKRLAAAQSERLQTRPSDNDARLRQRRLTAEEEQYQQQVRDLTSRQKMLAEQRKELVVRSPIAGEVVTWNVQQQLASRPLRRGDSLVTVADITGQWQLELKVPSRRAGRLLVARRKNSDSQRVSFVLATSPGHTLSGTVREVAPRLELDEAGDSYIMAKVDVPREEIEKSAPGATALAKIDCGRGTLAEAWFHDLIDTVQLWLPF